MSALEGNIGADCCGGPSINVKNALATWMEEIAPHGVFTTDRDLRITSWNRWLTARSGRSAAQMIGRRMDDEFPDLDQRRVRNRYSRALAGEISLLSTALHKYLLPFPTTVSDSGFPHMLQTARVAPLRDEGKIVGTFTIIEDVTLREYHAAILHRQQEMDRLLSSSLARLLQSNDPAEEMAEIFATISPVLGLDACVSYLLSGDEQCMVLRAAVGMSPKQRDSIAILRLCDEDRKILRSIAVPGAPVVDTLLDSLGRMGIRARCSFPLAVGNRLIGLVSFASYQRTSVPAADVTVLSRISRYVAIAIDRAIREKESIAAAHAKDDFLAALSHELRTPLNPVLLLASDAVENPDFPEEARNAFRVIQKNVLLEAKLIDDLLDLTRIEHGKLLLDMQELDVHAVVNDALETVGSEVGAHQLNLHVDLGAREHTATGDSGRLQQVFWNVIKNAVKFTPPGGAIWVTSDYDTGPDEIVVKVRDTGIGMDAKELARVFEAFAQGDHSKRAYSHKFGGLGLGMAISRKLIELHGGRIAGTSEGKGLGAMFTIRLPLLLPAATKNGSDSEEPKPTSRKGRTFDSVKARILLVEDHETTRALLNDLLVLRGFEVVSVASATAARQQSIQRPFDLVMTDLGLPDGNGYELMKVLRERHGLKGIALSTHEADEEAVRSSGSGFLAHLSKPINAMLLDETLRNVLAGRQSWRLSSGKLA